MKLGLAFPQWVVVTAVLATSFCKPGNAAELLWQAPADCPDRDALRWRIEDALGIPLANAAPLRFTARAAQVTGGRYRVVLDVASESGPSEPQRRELEAASCDEAVRAASVVIALALGADAAPQTNAAAARATEAEAPTTPAPHAAAHISLIHAAVTPKKSASPQPYWFVAQLGPALDYKSLPDFSLGVQAAALLGKRAWGVRLGGVAFPDRARQVDAGPSGRFTLLAASAAICGQPPALVRLCAGSELGRLSGEGVNTTHSWTGSSTWLAPFADVSGLGKVADFHPPIRVCRGGFAFDS